MGMQRSFGPVRHVLVVLGVALVGLTAASSALAAGNSLNAKSCQKNGWQGLVTSGGASFSSEKACTSYAAKGGVLKKPQTISFTSTNPSTVTAGGATYTPTATSTSGLAVAITLDASSTGCALSSAGVVSFTGAGTCVIDANQAGNATYAAAAQQQQTITVTAPASSATMSDLCATYGGRYDYYDGSEGGSALMLCVDLPSPASAEFDAACVAQGFPTVDRGGPVHDPGGPETYNIVCAW